MKQGVEFSQKESCGGGDFPVMDAARIGVVGLGYVGFPLLLMAAEKGHIVYGYDNNEVLIEKLKKGVSPRHADPFQDRMKDAPGNFIFSHSPEILKVVDVIIVCVPTPVDQDNRPNLRPLISAIQAVKDNMRKGQLIIIESTISPGTIETIVLPILTQSQFSVGEDFSLVHCPERIDPGNQRFTLSNISRVLAGVTQACTKKGANFYRELLQIPVMELSSVKAAEAAKIVENTFRDVNIALINELAQSFDHMGIDILEVIKGASTKPFAFMPHYPGCGVGGHCIPVDPYYLIDSAKEKGYNHQFLSLARVINNNMPHYAVGRMVEAMGEISIVPSKARLSILGVAYKADVDDIRESPFFKIIDELAEQDIKDFDVFDPYVSKYSTVEDLDTALLNKDCIFLVTDHSLFKDFCLIEKIKKNNIPLVMDGRNCLDKEALMASGILYRGIGR